MHELSIILEIIKTIEKELVNMGENADETRVTEISIQIGEMSSVLPKYIIEYFPDSVKGTILEHAKLVVENIPAATRCTVCGAEFGFSENDGVCPGCGSRDLRLISGREFFIKEIVLDSTANK